MHPIRRGTRPSVVNAFGRADVEFLESRTLLSVGSVSGTVFNDANLSYSRNVGEAGIAGVRVFVDTNQNGRLDTGEPSALSNAAGAYTIGNVAPGAYQVREVTPSGYRATSPWQGFWAANLGSGQNLVNFDFGNTRTTSPPVPPPPPPTGRPGKIFGQVFRDANGNGVADAGDIPLAGWRVYSDTNNNGAFDAGEPSFLSNAQGFYELDLNPGTYHIREVVNSGYTQTSPAGGVWTVPLGSSAIVTGKSFGNRPVTTVPPPPPPPTGNAAKIFGQVFRDVNGDGVLNSGDTPLTGWRVYSDTNNNGAFDAGEPSFLSNAQGYYELDLSAGTYHIREVVNSGYTQTSPAGGVWTLTVGAGAIVTGKSFGNKPSTVVPPPPPPPPPPPTSGAFVVTSTRAVWSGNPADDIVTFYARNTGTGALAGTRDILGEDATLSSAGGLVIRASSTGAADFSGTKIVPTASFVGLGSSMFVASATPGTYHDMQTVRQFEVAGLLIGGVLANSGAGAKIAVAIVPHASAVSLSGSLGAEAGPSIGFSASA